MDQFKVLENMLNSSTKEGKTGETAFARYLRRYPLDPGTLPLYLKFFRTGNSEAVAEIFTGRDPASFFSGIIPDGHLISAVLEILTERPPSLDDSQVFSACMGLLLAAYEVPSDGMKLHSLTVQELFHTARYFILKDEMTDSLVEHFLDRLSALSPGKYGDIPVVAAKVLDAHFDNTKQLTDVIPGNLLISE